MNVGKTLALLATLASIWGVTYMHDRAHRFDIVAAGAGSGGGGGSQDTIGTEGSEEIRAYVIDHQTGRVWVSMGDGRLLILSSIARVKFCPDGMKCFESAAQESANK